MGFRYRNRDRPDGLANTSGVESALRSTGVDDGACGNRRDFFCRSTWTFSIENGQGCYIPAYQRPYSWDKANAARLFEDATNGIEQMLQRASTISFLGTIIAIHDIKHVTVKPLLKQEVPQKVMTIIDGQQRLCTMMMINIAFHDHIRRLRKPFEGKADQHFKWIAEDCVLRVADLEKAILLDMNAGEENQRFYPRIIRAMDDQWSRRKAHAAYTSPIARLIKADLSGIGLTLSKAGEQIIKTADYNQTCKAIVKVTGDWSVELIAARSKRIAGRLTC